MEPKLGFCGVDLGELGVNNNNNRMDLGLIPRQIACPLLTNYILEIFGAHHMLRRSKETILIINLSLLKKV